MHHAANAANMTGYASAMVQGTYAQRRRGDAQNPVAQKQQILLVLITRHRLQVEVACWAAGRFVAHHLSRKGLASRRCKSFSSIFLKPRLPRIFWPGVGVGSMATRLAGRINGVTDVRPGAP